MESDVTAKTFEAFFVSIVFGGYMSLPCRPPINGLKQHVYGIYFNNFHMNSITISHIWKPSWQSGITTIKS